MLAPRPPGHPPQDRTSRTQPTPGLITLTAKEIRHLFNTPRPQPRPGTTSHTCCAGHAGAAAIKPEPATAITAFTTPPPPNHRASSSSARLITNYSWSTSSVSLLSSAGVVGRFGFGRSSFLCREDCCRAFADGASVTLTEAIGWLIRVTTTGVHPARMIRRARVLLALDRSVGGSMPGGDRGPGRGLGRRCAWSRSGSPRPTGMWRRRSAGSSGSRRRCRRR